MSYSISDYGAMIADRARTAPYVEALKSVVNEETVVLDIGTGTGFFALLACQYGARHVYAVEPNDAIQVARELAEANGFSQKVTFIQEVSSKVTLPEKADVIISDMRGMLPLNGQNLPSIIDARQRHLADTGSLIPAQDTIRVALAEAADFYHHHVAPWNGNESGLDMQAATRWVRNSLWTDNANREGDERVVGEPKTWATLDYRTLDNPNVAGEMTWHIEQPATVHGIRVWFDTILAEGVGFSNAPDQPDLIYGSVFFPWTKPVCLETGNRVSISIQANLVGEDYVWRWDTKISAGNDPTEVVVDYKQSSFQGIPISLAQLRKTAADHKPVLNEDGLVDLEIMQMMEQGILLEAIASTVIEQFPGRFADWQQALAHVGELSTKYSN